VYAKGVERLAYAYDWISMVKKMTAMHSMLMPWSVDSAFSDSICKTIQYSNMVTNNIL